LGASVPNRVTLNRLRGTQRAELTQNFYLKELLPGAYTALGNVLSRMGGTSRAEVSLRQDMEIGQQLGLASYWQLMAMGYLAYNLCGQGRIEEARQLAECALWSYTGNPETYEAYVCRSVLAYISKPGLPERIAGAICLSPFHSFAQESHQIHRESRPAGCTP
jgi:hypothetical protein